MTKIAVITGANRGLGWGAARKLAKEGYELVLLGRNLAAIEKKAGELERESGVRAHSIPIDLSQDSSIERAAHMIRERFSTGIDLLINNAGIFPESASESYDAAKVKEAMQVNALGPLRFTVLLGPLLMRKRGVVVNVSSGMGGLADMQGEFPGYRLSKTALNAATRYLSQEWKDAGVRVNSVCPGWVKTDMGGPGAERTIEEGVSSILWAAKVPAEGPTGGFYRDGKSLDW